MTLQQLEYFQVMSQTLHFTKAAEELHISQPGLSQSLGELERELGARLFRTVGKKVEITSYGLAFLPYIREALQSIESGKKAVQQLLSTEDKNINLGYMHSIGTDLLPTIIEDFYKRTATREASFKYYMGLNDENVRKLRDGTLNLAFTATGAQEDIAAIPVFKQKLYLIINKSLPLASMKQASITDLRGVPMVFANKNSSIRGLTESMFADAGVTPEIIFEAEECDAMAMFVNSCGAAAIVPMRPAVSMKNITVLDLLSPQDYRQIYLSWVKTKELPRIASLFKDFIADGILNQ